MLEDESHDRDDIADYVKSSLEIINAPQKELDQ
jgi:hypothetical protein